MLYTNEKAKPQLYYDMSMQKALFSFLYCKSGNLYMDSMRMMDQGFLVFNFNKATCGVCLKNSDRLNGYIALKTRTFFSF